MAARLALLCPCVDSGRDRREGGCVRRGCRARAHTRARERGGQGARARGAGRPHARADPRRPAVRARGAARRPAPPRRGEPIPPRLPRSRRRSRPPALPAATGADAAFVQLGSVLGELAEAVRDLRRETDAERRERVDDLAVLIDLITTGWQGLDARLGRIERQVSRLEAGRREPDGDRARHGSPRRGRAGGLRRSSPTEPSGRGKLPIVATLALVGAAIATLAVLQLASGGPDVSRLVASRESAATTATSTASSTTLHRPRRRLHRRRRRPRRALRRRPRRRPPRPPTFPRRRRARRRGRSLPPPPPRRRRLRAAAATTRPATTAASRRASSRRATGRGRRSRTPTTTRSSSPGPGSSSTAARRPSRG